MYKSKVYQPAYHLKENFMLYNFNWGLFVLFWIVQKLWRFKSNKQSLNC